MQELDAPVAPARKLIENFVSNTNVQCTWRLALNAACSALIVRAQIPAEPAQSGAGNGFMVGANPAIVEGRTPPYNYSSAGRKVLKVNLSQHFLDRMPSMTIPHFAKTLTFVCEHNEAGGAGIVINRR